MYERNEELKHDRYLLLKEKKVNFEKVKELNILNRFGPSSKQMDIVNVASSSKNSLTNASHH
jgi:hypothetical protein